MTELETRIKEIVPRTYNVKSFRLEIKQDINFKAGQFLFVTLKTDKEITKERERIKALVERKIKAIIDWRNKYRRKVRLTYVFEKLKEDLDFHIDNPDYIRKTKPKKNPYPQTKRTPTKEKCLM